MPERLPGDRRYLLRAPIVAEGLSGELGIGVEAGEESPQAARPTLRPAMRRYLDAMMFDVIDRFLFVFALSAHEPGVAGLRCHAAARGDHFLLLEFRRIHCAIARTPPAHLVNVDLQHRHSRSET